MKQKLLLLAMGVALTTQMITAQVPSYVPTNGLSGWWGFNGNANDASTNANNGTVNGATLIADRFGNANSAYNFNGTTNYIQTNLVPAIGGTSRTVSYWMQSESNQQNMTVLGYGDNNVTGKDFHIWHNWGCNGINMNISNAAITYDTGELNNNWKYYCLVFDNSTGSSVSNVKVYENGVLISTICTSYGTGDIDTGNTFPLTIGKYHALDLHYFNGNLDDIGVWNRALTIEEINNLYNANICYQNIVVTDTLVINTGILSYNPVVTYNSTVTISPNPAHDHITIDCGNLAYVTGYNIKIFNELGQEVFTGAMNTQQYSVPLNTWTGSGLYLVKIYDALNNVVNTKKIILQ